MTLEKPIDVTVDPVAEFQHGITRIAISSDGKRHAVANTDMEVVVYENDTQIYSGQFSSINEKVKPTERIRDIAFSPDGSRIYVAAGDQVTAVPIDTPSYEWQYTAPRSFGFLIISPLSLDVSENGNVVATFDNGSIAVWNSSGALENRWSHNDAPRVIRCLPGGDQVVGTDSFSLCVWDIEKQKRKMKVGLTGRVYAMDARSTGQIVATRTLQDVVIWDLASKDIVGVVPVAPGVPILALHPTQEWVACGERDRIKLATYKGEVIHEYELNVTSSLSLKFAPEGDELLVGCTQNHLLRLPVPTGR